MRTEANRMLSEWFQHATLGLNAKLAAVPKDAGDTVPPFATFADETNSGDAAIAKPAKPYPSVTVTVTDLRIPENDTANITQDFTVEILVQLAVKAGSSDDSVRHLGYAERALIQSLREFHKEAQVASRTRNQIRLYQVLTMVPLGVSTQEQASDAVLGLLLTYQGRDLAP